MCSCDPRTGIYAHKPDGTKTGHCTGPDIRQELHDKLVAAMDATPPRLLELHELVTRDELVELMNEAAERFNDANDVRPSARQTENMIQAGEDMAHFWEQLIKGGINA